MRLGKSTRRCLLAVHILFAATWIGGVIGLLMLSLAFAHPASGSALIAIRRALVLLDYIIIIPAAFGSLGSGLLFCWLTNWGFAKYRWVMLKWAMTASMILFGTFFLGPWVDGSAARAKELSSAALSDPHYVDLALNVALFSAAQLALLVGLVFLSAFKPWGRRNKRAARG